MNEQQAQKIIDLLQKLVDNTSMDTQSNKEAWTLRLLREVGSGEDQDNNGKVYGHDFIFSNASDWLPADLQPTQENLKDKFKGERLSLVQYAESLPLDDPKVEAVYNYAQNKSKVSKL